MDHLTDTPSLARMYCPGCEPAADPAFEILDVRWCASHAPQGRGMDDDVVVASAWISGSSEAGGEDNRRWCELLHRSAVKGPARKLGTGRRLRRAPAPATG